MTKNIAQAKQPVQLLAQFIEQPELISNIQNMSAGMLHRLIDHIGLEDAGELVSIATTEQLKSIFDEDLWKSGTPGKEEAFDAGRFALWLEIMLEVSESFAAGKLMELDENLVVLGLCRHIWVIDLETLMLRMANVNRSWEDDLTDKVLESTLSMEWDEYHIISKDYHSWDTIITVLVELDRDNHSFLSGLLERICFLSTEYIEDNGGLYNVLTSDEMLEGDLASEREDRRERKGYVSPSAATTFLSQAKLTSLQEIIEAKKEDPITRAYFNSIKNLFSNNAKTPELGDKESRPQKKLSAVYAELREAGGLLPQGPMQAIDYEEKEAITSLIKTAILRLKEQNSQRYTRCLVELNYLANILISGQPFENRAFRPVEAAQKVIEICNLGVKQMPGFDPAKNRVDQVAKVLEHESLVKLFKTGWHMENRMGNQK